MILSLDISSNVGWAMGSAGSYTFGTRSFSAYKGKNVLLGRKMREWLNPFLDEHKPSAVVIERPFLRGDSSFILIGLAWEAARAAEEQNIPYFDYAVSTVKAYLAGSKYANKDEMVRAARLRGYNVGTDHEADAIGLILLHEASTKPSLDPIQSSLF